MTTSNRHNSSVASHRRSPQSASPRSHRLKGLEGISRGHQSLPWPMAPVSFLTDAYLWGFKAFSAGDAATSPGSVLQCASLSLSQEGFNLNLSHCSLSSLLLVLSARGVENWLFLSSLQQSFTFLRIVLLTQTLLCTKSTVWGEVYLPITETSILLAIMSTGSISIVNSLYKMNWKLKWNLIEKLTLWEFIFPFYCPLKYRQDYFWLMCNWNKNKQTQLCQVLVLNTHHLGPQKLSSGFKNNKISAMHMKLFIIATEARFSESLSWASTHLRQLFMHQKIRCLVHLLWANGYGKPTYLFKVA